MRIHIIRPDYSEEKEIENTSAQDLGHDHVMMTEDGITHFLPMSGSLLLLPKKKYAAPPLNLDSLPGPTEDEVSRHTDPQGKAQTSTEAPQAPRSFSEALMSMFGSILGEESAQQTGPNAELFAGLRRLAGAGIPPPSSAGATSTAAAAAPPPRRAAPRAISDEEVYALVDPAKLQTLLEMGFPENRCKKALLLCYMSIPRAMEWLLENDGADADAPLTQEQKIAILTRASPVAPPRTMMGSSPLRSASPLLATSPPPAEPAVPTPAQTESQPSAPAVGTSAPSSPPPEPAMVQQLVSMGFAESEVLAALNATNNDFDAAAAWLLGEREPEIGPDNPIVHSILTNPMVRASLSNPRVMQAFQDLVQDPSSAMRHLADPEIGPLILILHGIITAHRP